MSESIPSQPEWVTTISNASMFIGFVANEWNKMEYVMAFVAAPLMGTSIYVARITLYAMNPPARRDYLSALSKLDPWTQLSVAEEIQEYVDTFETVRKRRNDIVHGRWDFQVNDDGTANPILTTIKGRAEFKEVPTPEQIKNIIAAVNKIQALTSRSVELGRKLSDMAKTMRP